MSLSYKSKMKKHLFGVDKNCLYFLTISSYVISCVIQTKELKREEWER
jgi:hypothetical protein